jgi:hypothetical protein
MNMKTFRHRYTNTFKTLGWGLLLGAAFSSCAELDQSPLSSINKEAFYTNEAEVRSARYGVYSVFTEESMVGIYNDGMIFINDLQSEYARRGTANSADIAELGNFAYTPANLFVEGTWKLHYDGINRANVLIDKIEANGNLDSQLKLNYAGTAKFLRAFFYFDLIRFYGDVPLVLHSGEGEGLPRTSQDMVYRQVVADLQDAEKISPGFAKFSSDVSPLAATTLLAKVYLNWAQAGTEYSQAHQTELYQKAADKADEVITSGKYALLDKFIDNWSLDKKDGEELIFTVEHKYGVNRNITGHCVFSTGFSNSKLPVIAALDNRLYDHWDSGDQRRDASLTKRLYDPSAGSYFDFDRIRFRKYIDTLYMADYSAPYISGQNTSSSVLRYSEVLLIKAEAENELNGPTEQAYDAVNQVRRRAYWNPYLNKQNAPTDGTSLELSGLSQEQLRQAVRAEYKKEFLMEGTRWFDLKRWHILVTTIKENVPSADLKYKNISPKHYYLPIPSSQIKLNPNLTQNWGYMGETSDDPYTAKGWQ